MSATGSSGEQARLRWLCRRGTRELDLLLNRFLDEAWPSASTDTRRSFERLLELQDPELYALLTGRGTTSDPGLADVVERIRITSAH